MAAALSIAAGCMIAYLFYDSIYGTVWALVCYPIIFREYRRYIRHKDKVLLEKEFSEYMNRISGALQAGYSLENAFVQGLREDNLLYGEKSMLKESLGELEGRLKRQETLEQILTDFSARSNSEDIANFVEIFVYAKRSGGNFIEILGTTVTRISDKLEILEEIHTEIANKVMEQKIMCGMPIFILLFLRFSSGEMMQPLYGNVVGIIIMTAALMIYLAVVLWAIRLVQIEV